jgi:DIS3-like exonuclease 1
MLSRYAIFPVCPYLCLLSSRSRYQLTYQQAQDVLDGRPPALGHDVAAADRDTLRRALTSLKRVTDHLRAARQAVRATNLLQL